MDFNTALNELTSCKTQDVFEQCLSKPEHNFTFKRYEAKKEVDSSLVTLDNEFIYVIKHPYKSEDSEEEPKEPNPNMAMFDKFGRGIVLRANFNDDNCQLVLMGVPLPFGVEDFTSKFDLGESEVTTLIDGTGVNVCKDPVSNLVFVSTRACGGYYPEGPTNYFGNRNYTYGTMFRESIEEHNMETTIEELPMGTSLHFVMEHPADHKVYLIDKPRLHLVNVFNIKDNVVTYEDVDKFQMDHETNFMTPIKLIDINDVDSIKNIQKHSNAKITPGIKLFHKPTSTWSKRLLTDNYERIKTLLGNDTNILFTLIRLRHQEGQYRKSLNGAPSPSDHKSVIQEFIEYFPEYSNLYSTLAGLCQTVINELFDTYLNVYTNRDDGLTIAEKLTYVPREFNDLVRNIHNDYRRRRTEYEMSLSQGQSMLKPKTTKQNVMSFFNGLPPAVIFDRLRQYSNRCEYMSQIFPNRPNNNDKDTEVTNKAINEAVNEAVNEVVNEDNDIENQMDNLVTNVEQNLVV